MVNELRPSRWLHLTTRGLAFCGLLTWIPGASGAQAIRIEPPVRVSPQDSGGHFWSMGNTHSAPDDPRSLITCGMRIRSEPLSWDGYLYSSSDGGLTWRTSRIDSTLTDDGEPDQVSETSCALARHGTMYMNTSVYGKWHSNAFQLVHSIDGGLTWSAPLERRGLYDATRSVVDNSGGAFDGHLYIFSNRFDAGTANPCYPCYEPLLTSADNGRSVQAAVTEKPGKQYRDGGWPSQAVVLNDGKIMAVHAVLFVASPDFAKRVKHAGMTDRWGIDVITSSDGGRSLDKPVTITQWRRDPNPATAATAAPFQLFDDVATLAVDRSSGPHRGRVYVGWKEQDNADPITRIMLSWSDDSGKTWSKPLRVDDARTNVPAESAAQRDRGTDPIAPAVAVNKDGAVGLLWMERFAMPSWRFSASVDGGATFLPSAPVYVTEARDEPLRTDWYNYYATAQDHPSGVNVPGHPGIRPELRKPGFTLYTQFDQECALTATTDGVFHAMWITRDDGALWSTRIHVDGNTSSKPAPSIEGLTDVSKRVRFEARNFHYDEPSARMSVDVVLVNTSLGVADRQPFLELPRGDKETSNLDSESINRPLQAPLILRMTSTSSDVGHLDLLNFDGLDSTGVPLVDWSEALPSGGLVPGARSFARRLEFKINDLKPNANPDVFQIINVSAEVYSR